MCIGPDDGCHEVPDPIAPIEMMFVSLEPTRTPISFAIITISGPMFIDPIPCILSMPGMFCIAPGEGLACGTGMFMPGMFAMLCFPAGFFFLVAARFFCGDDFLLIPGMFCMSWAGSADATKDKISIRPASANHRDRV